MLKNLRTSTLGAAYRMGGYIGWYLTVMFICERSLHYYHDDSMLTQVNITFLTASAITCAVLVAVLLLLDIEGVISDKLLRWLPGAFMAESGIALSLANASTMKVFAAITGVASAFGLLAVMSRLMKVKVGQRALSIGFALAIGAAIRLIAGFILQNTSQTGLIVVSICVGVIALMTVHSNGFSKTGDGPLISFPEAAPEEILSKLPKSYLVMFLCTAAFYFAHSYTETAAKAMLPSGFDAYYYIGYLGFFAAAALLALTVRITTLPMLAVIGVALSTAAALLSGLPYFSNIDAGFYSLLAYAGLACFKAAIYLFIIIFSLDRPHPLFFALFGTLVSVLGELTGSLIAQRLSASAFDAPVLLMLILIPLSGIFIYAAMKHNGFTKEQLARRHLVSDLIKRTAAQLELSERQRLMTELIVLDQSDIDTLSLKLLFSRNTVKVLLLPLYEKYSVDSIEGLREHFSELAQREEAFLEQVRAAEEKKRAEDDIRRLEEKYELRLQRLAQLTEKHQQRENAAQAVAVDAELSSENEEIAEDIKAEDIKIEEDIEFEEVPCE